MVASGVLGGTGMEGEKPKAPVDARADPTQNDRPVFGLTGFKNSVTLRIETSDAVRWRRE